MRVQKLLLLFLFLGLGSMHAQIRTLKGVHDFGNITRASDRTADFYFINDYKFSVTPSTSFFLGFDISTTHQPITLSPGDTLHYRVKITPSKKGTLHKTIPIFFYQIMDTVNMVLDGNALTTNFNDRSIIEPLKEKMDIEDDTLQSFPVEFLIIDRETGKPIPDAAISFYAKSPSYKTLKTDADGKAARVLNNRYQVNVYAYTYESAKISISVGCKNSIRTIYMDKKDPDRKSEYEYLQEYEAQNPITIEDTAFANIDLEDEKELLKPLEEGKYKPNNIVFLMDVSISMLKYNRMKLLKKSIVQLVSLLRPNDNISIITFSDNTKIIVPPTFLKEIDKSDIIKIINALKAKGQTNGGKGLSMAFKLMRENFDATKNNQVILATDGALNSYMAHKNILEMVKQNTAYASTSVVTLNGYNWSVNFMKEIVKAGKGTLLTINNETEARLMLIREIKTRSIIKFE